MRRGVAPKIARRDLYRVLEAYAHGIVRAEDVKTTADAFMEAQAAFVVAIKTYTASVMPSPS